VRGHAKRDADDTIRPVSVVIVASTDHDLYGAVASGAFRNDLYWRLARIELLLPPLRERRADVVRTAMWIGNRVLAKLGDGDARLALEGEEEPGAIVLTRGAAEALEAHEWPGNFRELDAVLERALGLYRAGSARIERAHIAAALARPECAPP
jgi:transcriptional regulator with GAF, ATPase, and Fis domain